MANKIRIRLAPTNTVRLTQRLQEIVESAILQVHGPIHFQRAWLQSFVRLTNTKRLAICFEMRLHTSA